MPPRPLARAALLLPALAALASVAAPADAQAPEPLGRLAEAEVGASLPPGWEARSVADAPRARTRVEGDGADRWIALSAEGGAVQLWRALERPREPAAGTLSWRWRVREAVPGAELTDPGRDDAPVRVFVVFGQGSLLRPPRTLFYSWGGADPEARAFRSHVSDRVGVVVLRAGPGLVGRWLPEERDLARDHRAVFGVPPGGPVTAVGVMIDTDQTGAAAAADVGWLVWLPRDPTGGG